MSPRPRRSTSGVRGLNVRGVDSSSKELELEWAKIWVQKVALMREGEKYAWGGRPKGVFELISQDFPLFYNLLLSNPGMAVEASSGLFIAQFLYSGATRNGSR